MPTSARERRNFRFVRGVAVAIALLTAVAARAGEAPAPAGTAPTRTSDRAFRPVEPLLVVHRDAEGGGWTLAPLALTAARSPGLDMAMNQSAEGLFTEPLPGGGFLMNLQGRFQSYSIARREADGGVRFECGENPLSLLRWLEEPPADVDAWGRPTR